MTLRLTCGYVPLLDAAPVILAAEIGFAAEEGLELALRREMSWAALRDKLIWGVYDAAHMLAPVVIAETAGLGVGAPLDAPMLLSVNGEVIGVSPELARAMGARDFLDARSVGEALVAAARERTAGGRLRIGVPFPFSTHAALVRYWLDRLGGDYELQTVPPPRMARAMAAGEIDGFCVGEPWGSVAVEEGVAELILPGAAIWQFAPDKVLALPRVAEGADREPVFALMRALWRAARWLAEPGNAITAAEILSRADYLDLPAELLERPLAGRLVVNAAGDERRVPRCVEFFDGAATFPWRSQGLWLAEGLARMTGVAPDPLRAAARASFRTDLYRAALGPIGADLPGASEKLEGAMDVPTAVASTLGRLVLGPDRFFDGSVFDPADLDDAPGRA